MSTKPIREALERIQCTCRDHSCVGCKAEAAVSAIERAAKVAVADASTEEEFEALTDLLESIAKDAP